MDYFGAALALGNAILDQIPDYDERKRKKYHELSQSYQAEKTKTYPERDDDLLLNLKEEIKSYWEDIVSHLEK